MVTSLRAASTASTALGLVLALGSAVGQEGGPMVAEGRVAFEDPSGDMGMISTSGDPQPALDLVGLAIESDGERITVTATLAGEPGTFADSIVELYIDADDDESTGVEESRVSPAGFDYIFEMQLCMAYDDGALACVGGTAGAVTERWSAVELHRYEEAHPYGSKERIIGSMFGGEHGKSERVPVDGLEVRASIGYEDIGVVSGQTVRILAREASGSPLEGDGSFPIVRLTLE